MNLVEWSFKFIKWTIVPICAECMYFVLCSSGYTRLCYIRSHYVAGIKCLEFALETLEWNTALRRSVSLYVSTCFIFVSADVASGKQCNETLHCEWPNNKARGFCSYICWTVRKINIPNQQTVSLGLCPRAVVHLLASCCRLAFNRIALQLCAAVVLCNYIRTQ